MVQVQPYTGNDRHEPPSGEMGVWHIGCLTPFGYLITEGGVIVPREWKWFRNV